MEYRSYNVTVRKSNGRIDTKYIDATDQAGAKAEATRYGKVLKIAPIKNNFFSKWLMNRRARKGFTDQRQIDFLQTMSNMLVGYPVGEALSIMIQNFSGVMREACQRLRQHVIVEQKDPIDALAMLGPKYIPQVTLAIIRSNAKVAAMHESFREGLEFQREILKIQSTHAMAMGWSMMKFIGAIGAMVATYLWGFWALEDMGYFSLMPETGKGAEGLATTKFWTDVMGIAALTIFGLWFSVICIFAAGRDVAPRTVERWIVKMPLLNGVMLSRINFMITYQIHKLLSKGVPIMDTFNYVNEELKEGVLKDDLNRVLSLLEQGEIDWVDGFHSFSDLDRALLKSATHQDEMANVFKAQSDQFLSSYDRSVSTLILMHNIVGGIFMFALVLIMSLIMFLPMIGGFDLVEQL